MTRSRSSRKSAKRGPRTTRLESATGPPPTALKYSGNPWSALSIKQEATIVTTFTQVVSQSSTGGGIIATVFDQTMTSLPNWTSFTVIWDEFRVLASQLEYMPANRYNRGVTSTIPGAVVIDRDSNAPLGSIAGASAYESFRLATLDVPWSDGKQNSGDHQSAIEWRMDGVNDSTWINCAAPQPTTKPCIKVFFSGLPATTFFGTFVYRVKVQFKGKF
jgi:hypothetical protein